MGTLLRTLALVKPDAVRLGRALDIKQRAELEGFTVLAQERIQARPLAQRSCKVIACAPVHFADTCRKLGAADAQPCGGLLCRPRGEQTQSAVPLLLFGRRGALHGQSQALTRARAFVLSGEELLPRAG